MTEFDHAYSETLLHAAEEELDAAASLQHLHPRQSLPHLLSSVQYGIRAATGGEESLAAIPCGDLARTDVDRLAVLVRELRTRAALLPIDPHLAPLPDYLGEVAALVHDFLEDARDCIAARRRRSAVHNQHAHIRANA